MLGPGVLDPHLRGSYGREEHQLNGVFSSTGNVQGSGTAKKQCQRRQMER
jgi:hypothetical protein